MACAGRRSQSTCGPILKHLCHVTITLQSESAGPGGAGMARGFITVGGECLEKELLFSPLHSLVPRSYLVSSRHSSSLLLQSHSISCLSRRLDNRI
ncbi:hypothetical protein RRG08_027109 [Elysia crispata]|uniref:Uncharacterized protein n=1 Tax=Elysia crispata TaxID=231223 RepID=A0AAE0YY05_9GAST|nr:hypothetical protein RRG08_027109 [Elysia crispata]